VIPIPVSIICLAYRLISRCDRMLDSIGKSILECRYYLL
jgi:hypothetical protein